MRSKCLRGFPLVLLMLFVMGWSPAAKAVVEIDITQGNIQPIPMAITNFVGQSGEDEALGRLISDVISANLERSGFFTPLNPDSFIERVVDVNRPPRFANWRVINAQALVVGSIRKQGPDRIQTEFRLWDVFSGRQLAGQQFVTSTRNWRRVGHIIADAIYERLTGEKGYFDTRIVFVAESGPKDRRVKRLALMDQDGFNIQNLTSGRDLVLTPRFSPDNKEITYMSYEGGQPRVYRLNLATRQQEIVGDFPGMTFAPRFSPDGRNIVMSLQRGGGSDIFVMNVRTRQTRQLTNSPAIDTAPSYSPDGRRIVFESDRQGGQQLFVMGANGRNLKRISFGDGSYSTPVWSPRGDLIAFTKKTAGRFLIGVMKPDGSGERILTEGFHNEGPTWAPNGRVVMFFRESPGPNGGPALYTVDLTGYNERRLKTPTFGSDPAWSLPIK